MEIRTKYTLAVNNEIIIHIPLSKKIDQKFNEFKLFDQLVLLFWSANTDVVYSYIPVILNNVSKDNGSAGI